MEPGIEKSNPGFIYDVKTILEQARKSAYKSVNTAMVKAYWLVGKRIVQEEQDGKERAGYGDAVLKKLSIELTADFGKGFSYANLKNFRQFYLTYPDQENCENESGNSIELEPSIGYTLCSLLTWSHNRLIMKVQDPKAGQMDMYRRMFDDLKKPEGDNPTIGILLCTDKSETIVKYSVMNDNKQLFAAKYMPYLPSEQELIDQIERDKRMIMEAQPEYSNAIYWQH